MMGELIPASGAWELPRLATFARAAERGIFTAAAAEPGAGFARVNEARESHTTPWGAPQPFFHGVFRRG